MSEMSSKVNMADLKNDKIPVHVSMIMDGNGRWAKERGKERVYGHFEGVESVRACVEAAVEAGVKYLSVFAFSEENWNRPEDEVVALMGLMVKAMAAEMEKLDRNGVRFMVLGNRDRLGDELNRTIDECMDMTRDNETLTLIVFLSYSGKWDILQAAKKLAAEMAEHTERRNELEAMGTDGFDKYLVTAGIPDPDLIVRTGGDFRISNFLLYQAAYAELCFTKTLWPDLTNKEIDEIVEDFSSRHRRFGGL